MQAIFEAAGIRCGLMGTVTYRIGDREIAATRTTPEAPDVQGFMRQMVDAGCGACVMEVSSHALAMRRVDGIRFAAGVFTNLTRDHLDFHQDMESYFAAKRRLFEMLPADAPAVVNVDDPRGASLAEIVGRPVTYAINRDADVTPGPLTFALRRPDVRRADAAGRRARQVEAGRQAERLQHPRGRRHRPPRSAFRSRRSSRGCRSSPAFPAASRSRPSADDDITVVVDYAHTDDALRNLLETARPLASRRLITVFGAGGDRDRTKRPLMGMVAARLSDVVVITSDNPRGEDPARIIDEVKRGAEPETRQGNAEVADDRRSPRGDRCTPSTAPRAATSC